MRPLRKTLLTAVAALTAAAAVLVPGHAAKPRADALPLPVAWATATRIPPKTV